RQHRARLEPAGMSAHQDVEEKEIRYRHEAGGECEPAVAEPEMKGEEPVECEVYPDRDQTNDHRQVAFIEGVECGCQHFHPRITGQPDRIETQGGGSLNRGRRGETSMVIHPPNDWLGRDT